MPKYEDEDNKIANDIARKFSGKIHKALEEKNVEKSWSIWNKMATSFLEKVTFTHMNTQRGGKPTWEQETQTQIDKQIS